MVLKQTKLTICDNSGAKAVKVFHLVRYKLGSKCSHSGDVVLGSV
jgi:ribosomal protein L14